MTPERVRPDAVISERFRWSLLGLTTLVSAFVVWSVFNPTPHSGGDNSGYIALAHGLLTTGTYTDVFDPERLPHTKYPPVFPVVLALLMAAGARTWAALKLAAAVPTVLAVVFTWLWAERRIGVVGATGVALLLTFSNGIAYYSQWILSDPLFLLFTIAALWAFMRADAVEEALRPSREGAPERSSSGSALGPADAWLAVGVVLTVLACFTRSAGLPLAGALLGVLALRRRWLRLLASGAALGVPLLLWSLRGRGEGVAQYGVEFWMVDPYEPALGTIGPFGLLPRIVENLSGYVLRFIPGGVVGADTPGLTLVGALLAVGGVAGWVVSARDRIGVAELFFPLYAGVILVWPVVWGGDRFALPLYPLLFVYTAEALLRLRLLLSAAAVNVAAVAVLLGLVVPAAGRLLDTARGARVCSGIAQENGPWACYGPAVAYFSEAAVWSAESLPSGSVVLSRKPRHFYLLSGIPSRAFPFVEDTDAHLDLADRLGARYVLLDRWDGLAARHVGGAVLARPGAFCFVRGFGDPARGGAQLLGILPPDSGHRGSSDGASGVAIGACPPDYFESDAPYELSASIPLLSDLEP